MKVLLISPLDPKVPTNLKYLMGGENTYTRTLLKNPPEGISYIHFIDALGKGYIKYTFWQKPLYYLIKFRILPLSSGVKCFEINYPFDLIHAHSYGVKLAGLKTPIVLSDSSSNELFLRDYLNWNPFRIKAHYLIRKYTHKLLKVYDQDLNLQDAKLIVFSNFAKKKHINLGLNPAQVEVISPGLLKRSIKKKPKLNFLNILFAGVWFERKGGHILLKAYYKLREKYNNISLTLLGPLPKGLVVHNQTIQQWDFVSYQRLVSEFYPKADILVLVPPKAEGFGMVVLEAASFGIPSIVSSVYALPETVEDGKTGLVIIPGSVEELTKALEKLIVNPALRKQMGKQAKKRFLKHFWIKKTNQKLLKIYLSATKN